MLYLFSFLKKQIQTLISTQSYTRIWQYALLIFSLKEAIQICILHCIFKRKANLLFEGEMDLNKIKDTAILDDAENLKWDYKKLKVKRDLVEKSRNHKYIHITRLG